MGRPAPEHPLSGPFCCLHPGSRRITPAICAFASDVRRNDAERAAESEILQELCAWMGRLRA